MSFLIFTIALAVVRSMFRQATAGKNIQKEIKKRLRRVVGGPNDREANQYVSESPSNDGGPKKDEESKGPMDTYREKAIVNGKIQYIKGKKNDPYKDIKKNNNEGIKG